MNLSEEVYKGIVMHAKDLAKNNKKETTEQLLEWINKNYCESYGGIRNVINAAHRRAEKNNDYEGIEALEEVFTDKDGSPLLK